MRCKIASTTDPPTNKSNRLTRTSSANRTIKSTATSSSNNNFKIKLKHGYSPSRSSNSSIHRTQTRSSTSSAASTSRSSRNQSSGSANTASCTNSNNNKESAKEMKKSKDSSGHRCNCICANCGLSIDDSASRDRDISLIREPINLGTKNVRQILQCVHNGTPEIKDIVLNECNIIYECRICRNLFRSLANLLSHKRFYCKDHRCESMLLFDDKYLNGLPDEGEDNLYTNLPPNVQIQETPNDKTSSGPRSSSTPLTPSLVPTTRTRSRRKQEITFAGPVDHRDEVRSSPLPVDSVNDCGSKSSSPDEGNDDKVSKKVQPEKVAAKRKHLESCVNKLLYEKSSPKLDQLTTSPAEDEIDERNGKEAEETKNQPIPEPMNMDETRVTLQDEPKTSMDKPASPQQLQEDNRTEEEVDLCVSTSTSTTTDPTTTVSMTSALSTTVTTTAISTSSSTASGIFNIDENANHPVAGEESESNMQEIVSYPQSISSLVSDDADCSHLSEMFPSEDNSEMDIESIGPDDLITNKESSQQSITSSSSPSSPSSSSSPTSSTREHSSNRNKPKTFDDTYETKPLPISTVPCTMCTSKFSSKKTLNVHIQTIHNVQRLIYPCPFCCLTFKQLFNATRHMIQVHRKGKTQVKFLREAVKRRAYPEVKQDQNEELGKSSSITEEEDQNTNELADGKLIPVHDSSQPSDNLDEEVFEEEEEEEEEEDKSNLDNPFNLKAVPVLPIVKVSKNLKRKSCDSLKEEEYKLSSSSSSSSTSSTKCSSSSEIKITINAKVIDGDEVDQSPETRSKSSLEMDKKESERNPSNQEKVRRVNPIIFSCINNCGEYFIKVDSKNLHEKKCSKPDDDDDDDLTNQEKSNCGLTDSSTSHNHHNHHHHHHHRSRDGLDLTIITESIYKELEKVGNLITRRCNHCPDLQFKTKSLLIQHLIVHIGYEVLKCKKCAYQTLNRTEMDNHLGSAHGTPEILRGSQIVNLSSALNDTNGSSGKKTSSRVELKEDSQESSRGNEETKGSSEKSNCSGIVLHLRPKLSRSRKKKKIYEIVGD